MPVPQILASLLTEQRLVLFSCSWARLTPLAECLLGLLHPLQWQHTFVPVLPGHMLDFLMAPTAFLMGCHLDYFEQVSKVSRCWEVRLSVCVCPSLALSRVLEVSLCLMLGTAILVPGIHSEGSELDLHCGT